MYYLSVNVRQKGRELTQSYDKNPLTHRKKNVTIKNMPLKHFDFTTIPRTGAVRCMCIVNIKYL